MKKTLHLTVRTPEAEIVSKEVNSIKVNTEGGEIEIYPHHASLTGSIIFGKLEVRAEKDEQEYVIQQGIIFVSVENNTVQILCLSCKEFQDIEFKTAKKYLEFVEEKLQEGADLNDYQIKYLENEKIAMVKQIEMIDKEPAKK